MKKVKASSVNFSGSAFNKHFLLIIGITLILFFTCVFCSIAETSNTQNVITIEQQQKKIISGKVLDVDGIPIIGANIVEAGTTNGTITDIDGHFSLNVDDNAVVIISYIGYLEQSITTAGQTSFTITLLEDTKALDEIVVVGYGTQRKVNLTGSVSQISGDALDGRPLTNASQALQGVNGLYVNQSGGQPGNDDATLRIRGVGTLNDNNPLVLVDGVEYSLKNVNPSDIESISVLKDAASASIYGNRAANGVILVTTKSGAKGDFKVEFNNYYGWQKAIRLPDMVTNSLDYMYARNQAAINEGQPKPYSDVQVEEYRNGTDPDLYPNTDWYSLVFDTAPMQEHYLRISGGTEKATYAASLGYLNQDGVLLGTDAQKYTLNTNASLQISEKLKGGVIINGSYRKWREPFRGVDDYLNILARALPIHPNILSNGMYGDTWLVTPGHNTYSPPIARAVEGGRNNTSQQIMANVFMEYLLPLDIIYKINFSAKKGDDYMHEFIPEIRKINMKQPNVIKTINIPRSATKTNSNSLNTNLFHTLTANRTWSDLHEINVLLGQSFETFDDSNILAYIEGFLGDELTEINAGTINKNVAGTSWSSRLMSYFGRFNYNYSNKYLLELNFRYDGSSRFAKKNRWGFFPSFSVGWRLSEEEFMKSFSDFGNMKLRFSYGNLGNQNISLYSYLNKLDMNQGTSFGGNIVSGSAVTALADPDISWEKTSITNLGLDLGFFNNKVEISIDAYNKITTDILARINIPAQVGALTGPVTNLYGMSNKGIEINLAHNNRLGDFNYQLGGNFNYVKNNVDYLNGDVHYTTNDYGSVRIIKEGYPVNSWFLYEAIGLFQSAEEIKNHAFQNPNTSPGDIKFKDLDGNNIIDVNDMSVQGRSVPEFTYGFNLNLNYKNVDLGAFFQGVQNIDIYPWHNVSFPLYNGAGITKKHFYNSWTAENPNAKYPRFFLPKRGSRENSRNSTFWLKDASYLRLKNIQLSYTLKSTQFKVMSNLGISDAKVYLNGQNLLTFSKFKFADPEKNILNQNIFDYPSTKVITIGLNLIF